MTYRDDLEAASERAAALERELAEARAENDQLKESARRAGPERAAREALARESRERKDVEDRWQSARNARTANLPMEHQRWFRIASSRMGFTRYGWFYYGLPFMILLPAVVLAAFLGEKRMPAILLCNLGLALSVIQIGRVASARAADRALAWLRDLPLPITGFVECFEERATRHSRIAVFLSYEGSSPELEGLRAFVGDAAEVDQGGNRLTVRLYTSKSALQSNRAQYRVMRRLVEGLILPLHREYRLTGVRFQANG